MTWSDGREDWYVNGQRHRTDGPAIVYAEGAGSAWYLNGELHRVDGPALEFATGAKSWYQKDSYTVRMGLLWKVLTEPGVAPSRHRGHGRTVQQDLGESAQDSHEDFHKH